VIDSDRLGDDNSYEKEKLLLTYSRLVTKTLVAI